MESYPLTDNQLKNKFKDYFPDSHFSLEDICDTKIDQRISLIGIFLEKYLACDVASTLSYREDYAYTNHPNICPLTLKLVNYGSLANYVFNLMGVQESFCITDFTVPNRCRWVKILCIIFSFLDYWESVKDDYSKYNEKLINILTTFQQKRDDRENKIRLKENLKQSINISLNEKLNEKCLTLEENVNYLKSNIDILLTQTNDLKMNLANCEEEEHLNKKLMELTQKKMSLIEEIIEHPEYKVQELSEKKILINKLQTKKDNILNETKMHKEAINKLEIFKNEIFETYKTFFNTYEQGLETKKLLKSKSKENLGKLTGLNEIAQKYATEYSSLQDRQTRLDDEIKKLDVNVGARIDNMTLEDILTKRDQVVALMMKEEGDMKVATSEIEMIKGNIANVLEERQLIQKISDEDYAKLDEMANELMERAIKFDSKCTELAKGLF